MRDAQGALREDLRALLARRSLLGSRKKARDAWLAEKPGAVDRVAEINRVDDAIKAKRGQIAVQARLLPGPRDRRRFRED